MSPTIKENRRPSISSASMSRPKTSVPSGFWSVGGASLSKVPSSVAPVPPRRRSVMIGSRRARPAISRKRARPRLSLGDDRQMAYMALHNGAARVGAVTSGGASAMLVTRSGPFGAGSNSRVDQGIDQVHDQVGGEHGEDRQQDDALDHVEVSLPQRRNQERTDARIPEDPLDEVKAVDDERERDGESGHLGQQRVPQDISVENTHPFEPLGLGEQDVVLAEDRDCERPGREQPEERRDDHDRERRQGRVVEDARDEPEVESGD